MLKVRQVGLNNDNPNSFEMATPVDKNLIRNRKPPVVQPQRVSSWGIHFLPTFIFMLVESFYRIQFVVTTTEGFHFTPAFIYYILIFLNLNFIIFNQLNHFITFSYTCFFFCHISLYAILYIFHFTICFNF